MWIVAAVAGVVAVAVAVVFALRSDDGADETLASPADALPTGESSPAEIEDDATILPADPPPTPPPAAPPPPEPVVLPPLAESDLFVRERLAAELGAGVDWLAEPDLVARAAAVMASGAEGHIPTRLLRFLSPPGAFAVTEDADGVVTIAPRTHVRFNAWVATATAIPPPRAAALVLLFEPLLAQALAEMGQRETPRALILAMLDHALDTPVVDGPIIVERPAVVYRFKNPALEARTPLQKQLLRMGPDNVRALKAYARAFRRELIAY